MPDPRVEQYARLLVERCLNVQPGWQVVVQSSPLARPLVEEVLRHIARRGAYALLRLSFGTRTWAAEAPEELLGALPPIAHHEAENMDAIIVIVAPENTHEGTEIGMTRFALLSRSNKPHQDRMADEKFPWVLCQFPTPAIAQEAGMPTAVFEDFLYSACLLDWDAEAARMQHYADRFDRADTVRIVASGTDLTLSLKGRVGMVDAGHKNMPGGEFFYSPVEDGTEGVVTFAEFPAVYAGNMVGGIRLVFKEGRVVEATAAQGQDFLNRVLNADAGVRVLGELGIGCNPAITRFMGNTLYDEKIDGTIHLALGNGFPFIGGRNVSAVHWDMVKDMRQGGQIYCDGELVQENGRWLI
ncbi:MAG TPA: aminopeptidase [Chloroflexia bacterium]|jgi:aminopeptidase